MITPYFKLDQNDSYLFINIRAPFAKLNEVDIFVESNDFRFHCKPYFLRLNLPGNILDNNETENGTYDFDEKMFKFKFEKETKGQVFDGLDLLTKLLTPINSLIKATSGSCTVPLIEEISANENDGQEAVNNEDDEDEELDWFVEQNLNKNESDENEVKLTNLNIKYGFAQKKSNVFSKLSSEYNMVIDLPEPDSTNQQERTQLRIKSENDKFDPDYYLADFFDDTETIESLLDYKPNFYNLKNNSHELEYSEKEIDCLKSLPKKSYLLDKAEKFHAFCGLVDILYAFCYNNRVNCGEKNVESGWNISKLSSTLSWFDTFNSLEEVLVASFRRSLCFPLYRNWKLSKAVLKDLNKLLKKGRKLIIKTLLEIRETFIDEDCRYILNDLFINDYCVWIQYISEDKIKKLSEFVKKIEISKKMVGFDLECIEESGLLAVKSNDENDDYDDNKDDKQADLNLLVSTKKDQDDLKDVTSSLDKIKLKDTNSKPLIEEL